MHEITQYVTSGYTNASWDTQLINIIIDKLPLLFDVRRINNDRSICPASTRRRVNYACVSCDDALTQTGTLLSTYLWHQRTVNAIIGLGLFISWTVEFYCVAPELCWNRNTIAFTHFM